MIFPGTLPCEKRNGRCLTAHKRLKIKINGFHSRSLRFRKIWKWFRIEGICYTFFGYPFEQPVTFLFQPPCPGHGFPMKYNRINSGLESNCHGIPWNSGNIPYQKACVILCNILQHADIIYVSISLYTLIFRSSICLGYLYIISITIM